MPLSTYIQPTFGFLHASQIDALYTVYSSAQIKTFFDSQASELKANHNGVITVLGQTNSDSGASNIGVQSIAGLSGNDVQTVLGNTKIYIDSIAANFSLGVINDKSLTPAKVTDDLFFIDQNYFTSTNSGNNYSITTGRSLTSITAGMTFKVKINADATGNTTLNVDGIGANNILKANGTNVSNLKNNGIYTLVYNGTAFILQGEGGEGTALVTDVIVGKTFTNDTGNVLTGTFVPLKTSKTTQTLPDFSGTSGLKTIFTINVNSLSFTPVFAVLFISSYVTANGSTIGSKNYILSSTTDSINYPVPTHVFEAGLDFYNSMSASYGSCTITIQANLLGTSNNLSNNNVTVILFGS